MKYTIVPREQANQIAIYVTEGPDYKAVDLNSEDAGEVYSFLSKYYDEGRLGLIAAVIDRFYKENANISKNHRLNMVWVNVE